MSALCLLALLATPGLAQNNQGHSHLIPVFRPTGDVVYDAYIASLDRIDDLTDHLPPNVPQLDAGMSGFWDLNDVDRVGEIVTNPLADDWHYAEHWFFQTPFEWDAELAVQFEPPAGVSLHTDHELHPYLYMDCEYRKVPPPWATVDLTEDDPALIQRTFFEVKKPIAGVPTVVARLAREWHLPYDAYVDHWLYVDQELVLSIPGETMHLTHDPAAFAHTAEWFDTYRGGSDMYSKVLFEENLGAAYY